MWAALLLMVWLAALSVVTAFYGAQRTAMFFNSLPLVIYWLTLTGLLLAGLLTFRRLIRLPGLVLIHFGCVFILVGAMFGSARGHHLLKKLFGIEKVPFGYMMIYEGTAENTIVAEDDTVLAELPFSIYLKDFRIEYYSHESYLQVEKRDGSKWRMPDKVGQKLILDEGEIEIVRVFQNFKIDVSNGQKISIDSPGAGTNPVVEIKIEQPRGRGQWRYVFERFPEDAYTDDGLKFTYVRQQRGSIRDYFSDVILLEGEKQIAQKVLEVNHPLHYGGYHFYQHSYDPEKGQYTILTVYSDSGLNLVYAGFLCMSFGILWHFWLRHIGAYFKRRVNGD